MENAVLKRKDDRHFDAIHMAHHNCNAVFHFERQRLNDLLNDAARHSLVVVCAGTGYGKTSAVHDFTQKYKADTAWVQLSERDNVGGRFWENYTHTIAPLNDAFAKAIYKLGFPNTIDKLNQYNALKRSHVEIKRRIIVMDDFHLIEDPSVIRFLEHAFLNMLPGISLFLISRSTPNINTAVLTSKGHIFNLNEDDLRFSENELAQYFRWLDIPLKLDNMREIIRDTEGWAFAINLIARSYRKAPGYGGYLRNAMKTNIFQFMETEIWDSISGRLQNFLIRLSLIGHLSVDLIELLSGASRHGSNSAETGSEPSSEELLAELERQSAYIRRDSYINAYLIHPLFLEFLTTKQELLSEEEKIETYAIAGDWCNENGFKIDALAYYEKTRDYETIVSIFFSLPAQVPFDIAQFAARIFDNIPDEVFDKVDFLAVMHLRSIMSLGLWQEASRLAKYYEAKFLRIPDDNPLRNHTLAGIYYCWGVLRMLMCTIDDQYNFDIYYAKLDEYLSKSPVDPSQIANHPIGSWISLAGSPRKGAPQDYINALSRAADHSSQCLKAAMAGTVDLAQGELKFYQGDSHSAEPYLLRALDQAREYKHFEIIHRALFYIMRIAVSQGNYKKMEQALKEIEKQLSENDYAKRFITYDIALTCYYYFLCLPEKIPDWLKDKFTPYSHAHFIENFGNQAKVRYCFLTKNYSPLLVYMADLKQRESVLFGSVEMLTIEACVHYKMKNKKKAFATLLEAYEISSPNGIITPFFELGKDMRTLTSSALKDPSHNIPKSWLENINRKSASYAKRQSHIIAEYKQDKGMSGSITFSPREAEILSDLSQGLSRVDIASRHNLSINTVKMVINMIYSKVGAENLADLIRIAVKKKLI